MSQERGTCWSITINNPTQEELKMDLPPNWKLQGQMEKGEQTETPHFQGCLSTPQVRFTAVKKIFPRAHIEKAKNKSALIKYVNKEETRLEKVDDNCGIVIPTLFNYQHTIAKRWDDLEYSLFSNKYDQSPDPQLKTKSQDEIALDYVDYLVGEDIKNGMMGVEYIAINPMWRSAWKKFHRQMVHRERMRPVENKTETESIEDAENQSVQETEGDAS